MTNTKHVEMATSHPNVIRSGFCRSGDGWLVLFYNDLFRAVRKDSPSSKATAALHSAVIVLIFADVLAWAHKGKLALVWAFITRYSGRLEELVQNPNKRIGLVLEDNDDIRQLTVTLLTRSGYEIYPAASVAEARVLLQQHKFDIAVLDCNLPDGNGLEILDVIAGMATKPVAIMVSGSKLTPPAEAIRRGAKAFLLKPYKIDELLAAIAA